MEHTNHKGDQTDLFNKKNEQTHPPTHPLSKDAKPIHPFAIVCHFIMKVYHLQNCQQQVL